MILFTLQKYNKNITTLLEKFFKTNNVGKLQLIRKKMQI